MKSAKFARCVPAPVRVALLCAWSVTTSFAQSTSPTAPAAAPQEEEDTVILSPFEVVAEDENGYLASNTAAGTRLASKIEDLGASITVVTRQQLLDTAAIDINDIFLYEANTEGTEQFTDFTVDRNGNLNDRVQNSPESANRVRGIGSANVTRGAFGTSGSIPLDAYNIDTVEISRGPNSTLAGLGAAAGTVNINVAKANTERDSTNFQLRVDDLGGARGSFDINRPIIRNKLAVRFSGMSERRKFQRKPAYEQTERLYFAVTARPFRNTTLRGSFESYWNYRARPNSITPRDSVSDWIREGMPTWDPVTFRANINGVYTDPISTSSENNSGRLPDGLFGPGTGFYNRPSMFIEDGKVAVWTPNRLSTNTSNGPNGPNSNIRQLWSTSDELRYRGSLYPLFVAPGIDNQDLYDWENINFVSPNWSRRWGDTLTLELEQRLYKTIYLGAGLMREDFKSYDRNIINASSTLHIDINERMLDGQPNPFFLRPFLQVSEPSFFNRPSDTQNARVMLAGDLDFTRNDNWLVSLLGRHQWVGYLESRDIDTGTLRFREAVLDDHWYINPANRTNSSAVARATYRYYVGDNQGFDVDYAPAGKHEIHGQLPFYYFDPRPERNGWVSEVSIFGEAPYVSNLTEREIRTSGAGLQSHFWDGRIVTTVGMRTDTNRSRNSGGATVDPDTGFYTYDNFANWDDWQERSGDTRQYGVVVKPLSWLNLHYNISDSFQPAGPAADLFGNLLPNPTGEGEDYGFSVSLFDNKLVARVNFYEAQEIDSRNGDAGIVASRARRLDFGGDGFNLERNARLWLDSTYGAENWTEQQLYDILQLPQGFIESVQGLGTADVSNVTSEGMEIELNYNPSRDLTFKFTAGKQETIDSEISPKIQTYLSERLPVWTSVMAPGEDGLLNTPDDEPWWTSTGAENFYNSAVVVPLKVAIAQQGKPKSQVRKWNFALTTKYALRGLGDSDWLKALTVGGSLRWRDKGSIGFLGVPDSDGIIRDLDGNQPIWTPAETNIDLWVSYSFRMMKDKIRASVQLNARNITESGGLQSVRYNPDGTPSQYRIIDPRQFILTTSFSL